ncbi:MAG: DUF4982 domain-containing protein [Clostridia bacterium]|nr:DUF4982 domain-containing protein [Clostridia bacterium]
MKKICISKDWYIKDFTSDSFKSVDLPHDYVVTAGRAPDVVGGGRNGYFKTGVAKYVKYLTLDESPCHYVLDVDGAYMCARIYVNEKLLALHPHGYTPFLLDITDEVIHGGINKLSVITDPMMPSTRWYSGGGLYRDVFLWTGGSVRVEPWDAFITTPDTNEASATVKVNYDIAADMNAKATVKATVLDAAGNAVATTAYTVDVCAGRKTPCELTMSVKNPALWSLETPTLYMLVTEITVDGKITDTAENTFGIRTFTMDAKNGFLLNGKPVKMRGGCIHHDHGVLGAASFPAAEARKVRKLKAAGFNALRIAHNPPSLALLEVCDREGIILMDEAFDMWNMNKTDRDYHLFFREWYERDLSYMVLRDRNHPCVFSYSIGNEIVERDGCSEGYYWSKTLSDIIRTYDATRPVTSGICMTARLNRQDPSIDSPEYLAQPLIHHRVGTPGKWDNYETWCSHTPKFMEPMDIVGYNYLYKYYENDHKIYPDRVMWGSETHAIQFYDDWTLTAKLPYVLGNFTWTAYDNLGEAGTGRWAWARDGYIPGISIGPYPWRTCYQGDLDLCGYRRPQSYFREAIWLGNTAPRIFTTHPEHYGEGFSGTTWHWYDVHETWTFDDAYLGKPVKCDVYTDADEIAFTLNGREVGRATPVKGIATLDIPYERGTLSASAYKNGVCVSTHSLETTSAPTTIVVSAERESIAADRRDLAYFQIAVNDEQGRLVYEYKGELQCTVTGGELMGIFSANPFNEDDYGSDKCHAFTGRALAIVRTAEPGNVEITVSAEGLTSGKASTKAE